MSGRLYVGTSGWYYDDWRSIFFPQGRAADPLRYIAHYLNAAEVNATYYRPMDPRTAQSWLRRLRDVPDFQLTAKLWQRLTHDRQQRPKVTEVEEFMEGLAPIAEGGRLAALLAQFPWSFRYEPENVEWLAEVIVPLNDLAPVVVEVRHDSWLDPEALDTLRQLQLGFCNIDQPCLHHCVPPTELAIGPIGYIRLHGRNAAKWFQHDEAHERYDYLYSRQELQEWVPRIRHVQESTEKTFVFCNNHYRAQAVVNALELKHLLSGQKLAVPPGLARAYPRLADIAADDQQQHPRQKSLF